jgi:ABC-type uncharacterized transport system substrate-binding protein
MMNRGDVVQKSGSFKPIASYACRVALLAAVCLTLMHVAKAQAHPHVFIVQRLHVVFDDNGMAGIRVIWKMDDMFASMIAEDHDVDKNGQLDAGEVESVKQNAFMFIGEHNFFTFITIDNQPFTVTSIRDFKAVLKNNRLTYEFFIPCPVEASAANKKIRVASYDPSYYTAIFFADKQPVSFIGDDGVELKTEVREDPDTAIYFDMIHPWTLFMEFQRRS